MFPPYSNNFFLVLWLCKPEPPLNMQGSFYSHSFPFKCLGDRKTVSPTSSRWWWDCCGASHLNNDQELGKDWQHPEMRRGEVLRHPPGSQQPQRSLPGNVRGPGGPSLCLSQWVGVGRASSTGPGNPDFSPKEQRVPLHSECSRGWPWRWQACPQPYRSLESNHPSQTNLKYLFTVLTTQFSRSTISV